MKSILSNTLIRSCWDTSSTVSSFFFLLEKKLVGPDVFFLGREEYFLLKLSRKLKKKLDHTHVNGFCDFCRFIVVLFFFFTILYSVIHLSVFYFSSSFLYSFSLVLFFILWLFLFYVLSFVKVFFFFFCFSSFWCTSFSFFFICFDLFCSFFLLLIYCLLFNICMIVNLYKQYFLSSYFSSQSNKWVFYLSTFSFFQSNTCERQLNLFYPLTFLSFLHFLSYHFFTSPTKRTLKD